MLSLNVWKHLLLVSGAVEIEVQNRNLTNASQSLDTINFCRGEVSVLAQCGEHQGVGLGRTALQPFNVGISIFAL